MSFAQFDPDLVRRYNINGPRYTSYPTADQFRDGAWLDAYKQSIAAIRPRALSLQRKQNRAVSFVLLGLTVFLAWLGIYSAGSLSPAIVMGNVGGGFAMLGGFACLAFDKKR